MEKDRGLTNELGYRNWIDSLAGEAILLGEECYEPDLVVRATGLARMAREIPYHSDQFSRVIAEAMYLEKIIANLKDREFLIYIEEVYEDKQLREYGSRDWAYEVKVSQGRYEIRMLLHVYDTVSDLKRGLKSQAEERVRNYFGDPSFETYSRETEEEYIQGQKFVMVKYFDHGNLIRSVIDHQHEIGNGPTTKGHQEIFYFDDYETAIRAWAEVKKLITSSRKR
ncbi:MAG: hypothetical protein UW68_C0039G0015 [Candidatus Collierbacteria bacterium GW2011_GWB1_44_6]|nr:MAG: hypothetical protein UW68_C0039G0015 [Candidatus Collierbacteria bacterium GW2011_GWB1_44_6]